MDNKQIQLGIEEKYNKTIYPEFDKSLTINNFDFFVIYSVDIPANKSLIPYRPNNIKLWDITEGNDQYEFDYLGGKWSKGKHRKYVARLTMDQFKEFVEDQYLYPEDCETMGSLTGFGWLPAISFNYESNYDLVIKNAYVTPILKNIKNNEDLTDLDENCWKKTRKKIFELFDY